MPRPLFIVNPKAGGGQARRRIEALRPLFEQAVGSSDMRVTEYSGHGIELARAAAEEGRSLVVAVGGDGTVHEVVSGLMRARACGIAAPELGIVGQGTGGDFARGLEIPHRLTRYLERLAGSGRRELDVGCVRFVARDRSEQPHYFVNILSVGMGGLVDRYVATTPRWLGGKSAYFAASLRALLSIRRGRLRIRSSLGGVSTERIMDSYMLAVCNGRFFGSGMQVAPMARVDDGVFEVVAMGGPNKVAYAFGTSHGIYSGTHLRHRDVLHWSCDRIAIELENEDAHSVFLTDCDGESLAAPPLEISLERRALVLRA